MNFTFLQSKKIGNLSQGSTFLFKILMIFYHYFGTMKNENNFLQLPKMIFHF
jgi:hypothetical protein